MGLRGYVMACSHSMDWNGLIWWNDHGLEWSHLEASHGCGLMDQGRSAAGSMWDPHQVLALDLCLFSRRSPGDCVGITPMVGLISRFLSGANRAIACRHAFLTGRITDCGTNEEWRRIRRHTPISQWDSPASQPWGYGILCFLWAFVTDQIRTRLSARAGARPQSRKAWQRTQIAANLLDSQSISIFIHSYHFFVTII